MSFHSKLSQLSAGKAFQPPSCCHKPSPCTSKHKTQMMSQRLKHPEGASAWQLRTKEQSCWCPEYSPSRRLCHQEATSKPHIPSSLTSNQAAQERAGRWRGQGQRLGYCCSLLVTAGRCPSPWSPAKGLLCLSEISQGEGRAE